MENGSTAPNPSNLLKVLTPLGKKLKIVDDI